MTASDLKTRTLRDLASLARKKKVPGWHSMRKDELVRALVRRLAAEKARTKNGRQKPSTAAARSLKRLAAMQTKAAEAKNLALSAISSVEEPMEEQFVLAACDPFWLHVRWRLARRSIERAKAVLGQHWYAAQPVLRLYEVSAEGSTICTRRQVRDVQIHGHASTWYIHVQKPTKAYQADIGYLTRAGRFYCLARSNIVSMPAIHGTPTGQEWGNLSEFFAESPLSPPAGLAEPTSLHSAITEAFELPIPETNTSPATSAAARKDDSAADLPFHIDTELIVRGVTRPDAQVTLRGEPIRLRQDGTFAVRCNLPERRHILPLVASSSDGARQRTIVLAVDRNLKVMEPVERQPAE